MPPLCFTGAALQEKPLCRYCGRTYSSTSNLKQHVLNVHVQTSAECWETCDLCGKRCKTKQYMANHRLQVHGIRQRQQNGYDLAYNNHFYPLWKINNFINSAPWRLRLFDWTTITVRARPRVSLTPPQRPNEQAHCWLVHIICEALRTHTHTSIVHICSYSQCWLVHIGKHLLAVHDFIFNVQWLCGRALSVIIN